MNLDDEHGNAFDYNTGIRDACSTAGMYLFVQCTWLYLDRSDFRKSDGRPTSLKGRNFFGQARTAHN